MLLLLTGYWTLSGGQPIMGYNLPFEEEEEELLMLYEAIKEA